MLTKGERRIIREEADVDIRLICLYVDGCCVHDRQPCLRLGAGVTCVIHIFQDRAPVRTLSIHGYF